MHHINKFAEKFIFFLLTILNYFEISFPFSLKFNNNFIQLLLKDPILDAYDISHQIYNTHQNIYGPSVSIYDSVFSKCHSIKADESLSGGGLSAHFGLTLYSFVKFQRVSFNQCTAKSSGGAFFITSFSFEASDICINECSAENNQAFFVHTHHTKMNRSIILNNGEDQNNFYYPSITIGFSNGKHKIWNMNSSLNTVNTGAIARVRSSSDFLFAFCSFSKLKSFSGLLLQKNGKVNINFCTFTDNEFNNGFFMSVHSPVSFLSCQMFFTNFTYDFFVRKTMSKYVTLSKCIFDKSFYIIQKYAPNSTIDSCIYNATLVNTKELSQKECLILDRMLIIPKFAQLNQLAFWIPNTFLVVIFSSILLLIIILGTVGLSKDPKIYKHNSLEVPQQLQTDIQPNLI